jgi:hypothetical protein
MSITITYPQIIEFADGTQLELNDQTWKQRLLLIETNRSQEETRQIFYAEQFKEAGISEEIVKVGQLGAGLIKKSGIWQMHVRLFQHAGHIQVDAEAELSNDYGIEHLTHGWISAFKGSWDVILKHFGEIWVYHKGLGKYVSRVVKEGILVLKEPETKTDVGLVAITGLGIFLIALAFASILKK